MTNKKKVFLIDDEEAIRHSASFMLRHAGYVVETFSNGPDFLKTINTATEGCVLLDVRMPEMDGLTVLGHIRESGAKLPVIILTGHGDVSTAVSAMKIGATDFLEKPFEKVSILNAIEDALSKVEAGELELDTRKVAQAKLEVLTSRERDVLELLVDGLTNKSIAEKLGISARTVEIHRSNLMTKLEADNLSSVLKIAFSANLGLASN